MVVEARTFAFGCCVRLLVFLLVADSVVSIGKELQLYLEIVRDLSDVSLHNMREIPHD